MALPKFEDWKAPWELDKDGKPIPVEDQKPDPDVLKKHLYNVLSDKEKAQTARDAALTQVGTLTTERDTLKTAAEQKSQEGLTEIQKLQQSIEGLTKRAEQAEFDKTRVEVLTKHKIKAEAHGLLSGTTAAELEASAAQLVALGLVETASTGEGNNGDNGEGAGQGNPLDTTPRQRLNPGDPNPGAEGDGPSVDDFVKQYGGNQFPL